MHDRTKSAPLRHCLGDSENERESLTGFDWPTAGDGHDEQNLIRGRVARVIRPPYALELWKTRDARRLQGLRRVRRIRPCKVRVGAGLHFTGPALLSSSKLFGAYV